MKTVYANSAYAEEEIQRVLKVKGIEGQIFERGVEYEKNYFQDDTKECFIIYCNLCFYACI